MKTRTWDEARSILCVRLDSLGDVLMTTPALRALRQTHPGRRITLLTSNAGAEVARLVPEIDETIVYDAPWLKATLPRDDSGPEYEMSERLWRRGFDAAVIFTVFSQNPLPSAMLCYLAGIPLRLARCRENPYQLLTDWVPEDEPDGATRHEVRRQLDLVAAAGALTQVERMSLAVPPEARERVDALLSECGMRPGQPWYVLHPGASASSRRYPPEAFAAAAQRLAGEDGARVLVTGSSSEASLVAQVCGLVGSSAVPLAGMLDLADMAALLERAPLLLTNNTGPAHIAAALQTPVVDLYAGTNPQHTPWMTRSRVLTHAVPCAPCYKSVCPEGHHACLRAIPPDDVVQAVRELMPAGVAR